MTPIKSGYYTYQPAIRLEKESSTRGGMGPNNLKKT
jgi:hypothetical protein